MRKNKRKGNIKNESESEKKVIKSSEIDLTEQRLQNKNDEKPLDVKKQNKVLDSLAIICQFSDECAAVSFDPVEKNLIITANHLGETFKETENSMVENLQQMLNYFSKLNVILGSLKSDEEIERFKIIRSNFVLRLSTALMIPEYKGIASADYLSNEYKFMIIKELIDPQKINEINLSLTKEITKNHQLRNNVNIYISSVIHGTNALKRIEKSILKGEFSIEKFEIARVDEKGVHAEIRQLSRLHQKGFFEKNLYRGAQVYIGISKGCCLDCHFFLKAIKEVTGNSSYKGGFIDYSEQNTHFLQFKGWAFPNFCSDDIKDKYVDKFSQSILSKFYELKKEYFLEIIPNNRKIKKKWNDKLNVMEQKLKGKNKNPENEVSPSIIRSLNEKLNHLIVGLNKEIKNKKEEESKSKKKPSHSNKNTDVGKILFQFEDFFSSTHREDQTKSLIAIHSDSSTDEEEKIKDDKDEFLNFMSDILPPGSYDGLQFEENRHIGEFHVSPSSEHIVESSKLTEHFLNESLDRISEQDLVDRLPPKEEPLIAVQSETVKETNVIRENHIIHHDSPPILEQTKKIHNESIQNLDKFVSCIGTVSRVKLEKIMLKEIPKRKSTQSFAVKKIGDVGPGLNTNSLFNASPDKIFLEEITDEKWYKDDEINALFQYVTLDNPQIHFLDAMLGTNWEGVEGIENTLHENLIDFNQQRLLAISEGRQPTDNVLIPVNLGNYHWVLLYIRYPLDAAQNPDVFYFDPLGTLIPPELLKAVQAGFLSSELEVNDIGQRVQKDGYNCGPWIVLAAQFLTTQGGVPEEGIDIELERKKQQNLLNTTKEIIKDEAAQQDKANRKNERYSP